MSSRDRLHTLSIRTPEGIEFSLLLAGPVTRFLAWFIDAMVMMIAGTALIFASSFLGLISPDFVGAFALIGIFAIQIGYGMALEWLWRGQTIGKRIMKLQVMDAQGLKLQFSQIVVRNLLRFIDSLPALYLVGGAACLLGRRSQRLGDFAANTVVVRRPRSDAPDLDQLGEMKYNSFRNHPHLAARLRQRVAPREAVAALQALFRRDELEPGARVRLFGRLAEHFREAVEFPAEATDGLADEQYVRNVIDVLFQVKEQRAKTRTELN